MTMGDREGLVARIQQLRRARTPERPAGGSPDPQAGRIEALEARVAHLEQLLEGLQDSVHRGSQRHGRQIAELQARIEPATMGAALAEDARERGL